MVVLIEFHESTTQLVGAGTLIYRGLDLNLGFSTFPRLPLGYLT